MAICSCQGEPVTPGRSAFRCAGCTICAQPFGCRLLLRDGVIALYSEILALVESRVRPEALIVADNANFRPDYLRRVRAPGSGYL